MTQEKRFLRHLAIAFVLVPVVVLGLVTWMDPYRNLGLPWQTFFVSDRNVAYKRFKLLQSSPPITDLVVGSSTCEVFQPQYLRQLFSVESFNAGMPAASTHVRYIMMKEGLKTHPELKRIIYVADLFEFRNFKLPTKIYYQPELRAVLDKEDLSHIPVPTFSERFNDVFSNLVIERSFATLNDLVKNAFGKYKSRFHRDGGTNRSMILVNPRDPVEIRAASTAIDQRAVYGVMSRLDGDTRWMYGKIVKLIEQHPNVELHLVIPPYHEVFYDRFKKHFEETRLYEKWLRTLRALDKSASGRVHVHDFSYPIYFNYGITSDSRYWIDGIHYSSETMKKIATSIYNKTPRP